MPTNYYLHLLARPHQEALDAIASFHKRLVACFQCGCDDRRILQIHHGGGGGAMEVRRSYGKNALAFYTAINTGERSLKDLGILCRVCNNLEFIERRFPDLLGDFTIQFRKNAPVTHKGIQP